MSCNVRPAHLFLADNGDLFDTRRPDWHKAPPLRRAYAFSSVVIDTVADLKAALRAGDTSQWGGYPLYFITSDGAALSFESVRKELPQVIYSIANGLRSDGWHVCTTAVNYENRDLVCDHSGQPIACAYGD